MNYNVSVDCLGLYCPMPIIKTAQIIKEIEIGEILEIIADDNTIVTDMPNWCKATKNEFLGIEDNDGEYKVYIKRAV